MAGLLRVVSPFERASGIDVHVINVLEVTDFPFSSQPVGLKHETRTKRMFISQADLKWKHDDHFVPRRDLFFRKLAQSDRLLTRLPVFSV